MIWPFLLLYFVRSVYTQDVYRADNAELTAVPGNIPTTTVTVSLQYNSISSLPDFSAYTILKEVDLYANDISVVSATAFCGTVLENLYMGKNKLTQFPDLTCVKNTLKRLKFHSNSIGTIAQEFISPLTKLMNLFIQNNQLTQIPDLSANERMFQFYIQGNAGLGDFSDHVHKLSTVRTLYVGPTIPSFDTIGTNRLKFLNFQSADFTGIQADHLSNLNKLDTIKYQACDMTSIPQFQTSTIQAIIKLTLQNNEQHMIQDVTFQEYTNLQTLEIRQYDHLTKIPPVKVASLTSLTVSQTGLNGTLSLTAMTTLLQDSPLLETIIISENQLIGRNFNNLA